MALDKLKFAKKGAKCPRCSSSDAFFGLIENGNVSEIYGKCFSCGQFFPPKKQKEEYIYRFEKEQTPYQLNEVEFLGIKEHSRNFNNNFINGLLKKDTGYVKILKKYNVVSFSDNVIGFPYISENNEVRSIKKIEYNDDLHRNKENKFSISWYHSGKTAENEYFKYCFFGENLISLNNYKYIGVVESEKTAIIASLFFPDILFIATGSKSTLSNLILLSSLKKKKVLLFPDADGYKEWLKISKEWGFPENWKFADICKRLTNKQDIADVLFVNSEFAEKIRENINELFGKKINIAENSYYMQILKDWTARDIELMLDRYGINEIIVKFEIEGDDEKKKIRKLRFYNNQKESIMFTEVMGDYLTEFCVDYQIINYNYLIDEKFTMKDVSSRIVERICYSNSFFGDMVYRADNHTFNNIDFKENVKNRILNFTKTNLFSGKLDFEFLREIVNSSQNQHLETLLVNFPNKSFGYFDEILTRGKKFFNEVAKSDQFYINFLTQLYGIENIDYECFVFFCCAAQKLKLYGDPEFMRALVVVGEGGIGKDYIITSLILGEFRKYSKLYYDGSEKGATDFSTLTPEKANKILINIISDNIDGLNKSVKLDNITNEMYKIENKGVDIKQVARRFLTVATTNKKGCLFSKDDNDNAFARRFLLLELNKTATIESYKNLTMYFVDNKEAANDFFAGWFYFINTLLNNKDLLQNLYLNTYNYMLKKKSEMTYVSNDDEVICDDFYEKIKKLEVSNYNPNMDLNDNTVYIYSIRELARYLCLGKFSSETVKKAIVLKFNNLLKFNTKRRKDGKVANVALQISDFEAFVKKEYSIEEPQTYENKDFIKLLTNYEK